MLNPKINLAKNLFIAPEMKPTRDGYGRGVLEIGEKNDKVVVLCCDLSESTRSLWFKEKFPERFIEMGIQEQNMAGVAAGLAQEGYIPFISSYSVFSPGRNWDQIRVSICYNNVPVKIMGAHSGISVGPDGATHQALEDIAITRVLPRMTVIAPCDAEETRKAVISCANVNGPVYIRFAREKTPVMTTSKSPFKIGRAEIFAHGRDVTIIAAGPLVYEALLAARSLASGEFGASDTSSAQMKATVNANIGKISAEVINVHTIKPLDIKTIVSSVKKTGCAVCVEEHQINGGLGGAVAEELAKEFPVPIEFIGMQDTFGESGAPDELLESYGMKSKNIIEAALKAMKRKNHNGAGFFYAHPRQKIERA